ncbi:MAG: hypothetical protein A2136_09975 [Chloroflexi bacterium RBG_16_54_11]|nr:MAG: hypothetical protein A2136_09975 [Chloroflexi bacterium RBG_16_54_11]
MRVGVGVGVAVGESVGLDVDVCVGVGVEGERPGRLHARMESPSRIRARRSFFMEINIHGRGRGVKESFYLQKKSYKQ